MKSSYVTICSLTGVSPCVEKAPRVDDLVPHGEGEVGEVVLHQVGAVRIRCVDVDRRLPGAAAVGISQRLPVRAVCG